MDLKSLAIFFFSYVMSHRRCEIRPSEKRRQEDEKVEELLRSDSAGSEDRRVLLHAQVLCVDAHHQLYEGGECQEREHGGKGNVVGEVDGLAFSPIELDLERKRTQRHFTFFSHHLECPLKFFDFLTELLSHFDFENIFLKKSCIIYWTPADLPGNSKPHSSRRHDPNSSKST